ncbi:MAG TPA: kelch repeat-containing protein [Verrucomicrobiota bacterium]|nr:kelch repeat-containing protein [Verrucomicrobiota bacterium]HQL78196.1 kelch repeat-containing protein [Verrucomicrobiota bacterium]
MKREHRSRCLSLPLPLLGLLVIAWNDAAGQSGGNSPSARDRHTAVWTGKEMIVWGGYNSNGPTYFNSGARYNPTANTWTSLPANSAPSARVYHAAVWTGTQMIVWGGYNAGNSLVTGSHYNPTTDSWTATGPGAPVSRYYHSAVWTGTEMIVWGGRSVAFYNDGGRYSPYAWSSLPTAGAPSARDLHTAVWTGTEMIVWGGYSSTLGFLNDGARYAWLVNWGRTMTSNGAPAPRDLQTAVWTGTEMIVWGGYNGTYRFADGGRYDPSADAWTSVSTSGAPGPRDHHTAVWTGTEMIVWGGFNGAGNYWNDGARYNPQTDSWTPVSTADAPSPRAGHTAVWTGTEMIVWGGFSGASYATDGGRYNPATDSWVALPTSPAPPLSISRAGSDSAVLSWPSPAVGHALEENSDLGTTNWTRVAATPSDDGVTKSLTVPFSPGEHFYRLK